MTTPSLYNFDMAVKRVIASFGEHPMNAFFLASYLAGFPPTAPYKQSITENPKDRFLTPTQNPELRFWTAVNDCYCLSESRYKKICLLLHEAVESFVDVFQIEGQNHTLIAALMNDIEHFDLKHGKEQTKLIRDSYERLSSEKDKSEAAMEQVVKWSQSKNTFGRSYHDIKEDINTRHKSRTNTVMWVLRTLLQGVTDDGVGGGVEVHFAIHLMFKDNFRPDQLERKAPVFGKNWYTSPVGVALWRQYDANIEAFRSVVQRYLAILFYSNYAGYFDKALLDFKQKPQVRGDASRFHIGRTLKIGWVSPTVHLNPEDLKQLDRLVKIVKTWDSYKAIRSGKANPPPAYDSSKKAAGSS
jgi:hypothetical protein